MERQVIFIAVLCLCLAACGDSDINEYQMVKDTEAKQQAQKPDAETTTEPAPAPTQQTSPTVATSDLNAPGDVAWTAPEAWKQEQAGGMRLASYKIPHDGGDGDLSVISLGGDGGGMLANINRWRNQVGLDPIGPDAIAAHVKEVKSAVGTFTAMTLVNDSSPNKAICGAVLTGKGFTLFVKLTASKACVEANAEAVYQFCANANKAK